MIKLLSHPNEMIVDEVLLLLQALLESGNREVQKNLLLELKTSQDSLMFPTLLRTITRKSLFLYKER